MRQERSDLGRLYEGQVATWGTGRWGQLGLGRGVTSVAYPTFIPKFVQDKIVVRQVAAGARHMLAVTQRGELYSWGQGKSGKLG